MLILRLISPSTVLWLFKRRVELMRLQPFPAPDADFDADLLMIYWPASAIAAVCVQCVMIGVWKLKKKKERKGLTYSSANSARDRKVTDIISNTLTFGCHDKKWQQKQLKERESQRGDGRGQRKISEHNWTYGRNKSELQMCPKTFRKWTVHDHKITKFTRSVSCCSGPGRAGAVCSWKRSSSLKNRYRSLIRTRRRECLCRRCCVHHVIWLQTLLETRMVLPTGRYSRCMMGEYKEAFLSDFTLADFRYSLDRWTRVQ
ncbi:uncharacterized protein V6R79_017927 [Siganus canaliculatus]